MDDPQKDPSVRIAPPKWTVRLDRCLIFNPARWPHRELMSRLAALGIIGVFLWLRIHQFDRFPQYFHDAQNFYARFKTSAGIAVYSELQIELLWAIKLLVWLVETAIYLGYIAAYASRARAVAVASGFMETAFPVIVAGLPVLMAFTPYSLPRWVPFSSPRHLYFYAGITMLIFAGGLINLIGLIALRRAFSIMSEARELVVGGIFRYIRHPLYTGHFIMFFGSLLLRLNAAAITMYVLFCIGQVIRAGIEERKLLQAFPRYADYRSRTGRFFPRIPPDSNKRNAKPQRQKY